MTPFWNYIIIRKHLPRSATKPQKKTLQESMGVWGLQILETNSDKSFVTPVWNFVVVSPSIFWVT